MSFILPLKRLRETKTLIAFLHPKPSYGLHILLLPKEPYASLLDVPVGATEFLTELLEAVQSLIREYGLEQKGYRLIANGGPHQEVGQLHFHLVSDQA